MLYKIFTSSVTDGVITCLLCDRLYNKDFVTTKENDSVLLTSSLYKLTLTQTFLKVSLYKEPIRIFSFSLACSVYVSPLYLYDRICSCPMSFDSSYAVLLLVGFRRAS